jgi:anti-anti-sigma factor
VRSLEISVAAGESGPVVVLQGQADLTSAARLNKVIAAQLSGRTATLTIDASRLRFADSRSIRVLMAAAVILRDRGGSLVLLRPQQPVARALNLLGVGGIFTIRTRTQPRTGPDRAGMGHLAT